MNFDALLPTVGWWVRWTGCTKQVFISLSLSRLFLGLHYSNLRSLFCAGRVSVEEQNCTWNRIEQLTALRLTSHSLLGHASRGSDQTKALYLRRQTPTEEASIASVLGHRSEACRNRGRQSPYNYYDDLILHGRWISHTLNVKFCLPLHLSTPHGTFSNPL